MQSHQTTFSKRIQQIEEDNVNIRQELKTIKKLLILAIATNLPQIASLLLGS